MFTLEEVVPWGRSFDEYSRMFALTEGDLACRILGCGDGPASFNAEATAKGHAVVSCDPLYRFSPEQIRERIASSAPAVLEQTRQHAAQFVWTSIDSVEELGRMRMVAMASFVDDFGHGGGGRYVAAALPVMPFISGAFDIAVCSHFLFLYSAHHDQEFHVAAVRELARVAREVRIFPLLTLGGERSPYVTAVTSALKADRHVVTVERVGYEFQRGGHEMLRVRTGVGPV